MPNVDFQRCIVTRQLDNGIHNIILDEDPVRDNHEPNNPST